MEEDFGDPLSFLGIGLQFDKFEKLYNKLGKACEANKLSQISSECLDFARKLADEVAAEWFDMEIDENELIDAESKSCIFVNNDNKEKDLSAASVETESSVSQEDLNQRDALPETESSSKSVQEESIDNTLDGSSNDFLLHEESKDRVISEISSLQGHSVPIETYEPVTSQETETDSLVGFVKPQDSGIVGDFEKLDLENGWDDDVDYDLALASYRDSKIKPSKIKLAACFISKKIRHNAFESVKSVTGFALPDASSAESDWELL